MTLSYRRQPGFAHGVITRPETLHICYMNSPGRMFWEPQTYFSSPLHLLISPFLFYLRLWDYAAAQRVDHFIANSKTPRARIKKYYGRDAEIIYPFVDLERFRNMPFGQRSPRDAATSGGVSEGDSPSPLSAPANAIPSGPEKLSKFASAIPSEPATLQGSSSFFLVVSRLTSWKRIDIVIKACNRLNLPLKIIGEGPDQHRLEKLAGPTVELLGRLTDKEVVGYYQNCRAFLFPQKEDFGITPLEAMAAGKPVIAYKDGGALETVVEGKTGAFFYPQTAKALIKVLKNFNTAQYQSGDCHAQAAKFGKERFKNELKSFVKKAYAKRN